MKVVDEITPMARSALRVRRITACGKDRKEVERREFEIKGLALIRELKEEVNKLKKQKPGS